MRRSSPASLFPPRFRFAGLLLLACTTSPAHAQLFTQYFPSNLPGYAPDLSSSVVQRELLQTRHPGVMIGDFNVLPFLSQSTGYTTNLLGQPHSGSAQIITSSGVRANSLWRRNALGFSANVANTVAPELMATNTTTWSASGGGSLSLGNDSLALGYSHSRRYLGATDLGNFGISYPVPYDTNDIRLNYQHNFGRFSITPSVVYDRFDFGQSSAGPVRNFNSLNHQLESVLLTTRLEISRGNGVISILRASAAQFAPNAGGTIDDYADGAGFLGLDIGADSVIQYRALAGAETRQFTRIGSGGLTTPTAELDVIWTPTRIDTVTVTGRRGIFDPSSPFARNQIVSDLRLQLDHEFRPYLFLRGYAEGAFTDSQSLQAATPRLRQTQFRFGLTGTWTVNRYLTAVLSYTHNSSYTKGAVPQQFDPLYGLTSRSTFTTNTVSLALSLAL
ncbi:outer membrane beta-barrel protein [Acidomonas methanolica]|uniref:outer membrane beta-barrel protein n=1 Tax=Acidomonas methanolica TaxID=437 RepID=UPI001C05DA3F|nr:outer membrane beta-barrel protein [Acidomonas methanolica]MBU2654163.1 outer membrane beta-barrel protein [Acidomonas methanolica]